MISTFQFLYFYIICKYLFQELEHLNKILFKMRKRIEMNRIMNILHSLDALYREINEYNTTYWSKFLLNIWLFFGTAIVFALYFTLFGPKLIVFKIAGIYALFCLTFAYLLIMNMVSNIYDNVEISHSILNSVYVSNAKLSKVRRYSKLRSLIKVSIYSDNMVII